jgi:pyrroline-5-carboxylate reductase
MSSIAFIGGGNMASCIIGGMVADGFNPEQILVGTPSESTRQRLAESYGVVGVSDNHQAVAQADLVVLAVKPHMMRDVIKDLAPALGHKPTIVSVAAGIPIEALSSWLRADMPVVRAMPNTPSMLKSGATGLYANRPLTDQQQRLVESIFESIGYTCWVNQESLIDAVIAVSGSGPAYFFLMMEAMQKIGTELGLTEQTAHDLCVHTALGASRMATETGMTPTELRAQVTSPGGTTNAAIASFQQQGLEDMFRDAMNSAVKRAEEMSRDYSA